LIAGINSPKIITLNERICRLSPSPLQGMGSTITTGKRFSL
jgi:hypothetical protein